MRNKNNIFYLATKRGMIWLPVTLNRKTPDLLAEQEFIFSERIDSSYYSAFAPSMTSLPL